MDVPTKFLLLRDFLSLFKTETDVAKLYTQVLKKMLYGEKDAHLGMKRVLWLIPQK